ncbi:MAG: N,N-dimethylformamidase beta subunit family domain-containing protein [Acidimicrobiales bacterium]
MARIADLPRADIDGYFADYSYWSCAAGWANWERLFVAWAETEGLELDYATSHDLANEPELLEPYDLYVSVGHDEYWSASMRDSLEGWVDRGGFAAFFSGNTAFWQVRFEGSDHRMVGYKMDFEQDPVMGTEAQTSVSTMWSDPLTGRPENEMTGVSFTRGGYAHCRAAPRGSGGYSVWRPAHWAFDGVALRPGDIVGAEPVVVGYECDGCELTMQDGLPVATGSGGTPANIEVLGTAPARLWLTEDLPAGLSDNYVGELNWVASRLGGADTEENRARFANGAAVMATFARGQGEVFTVGCTDWAYGLDDPDIARITHNVIFHALDQ